MAMSRQKLSTYSGPADGSPYQSVNEQRTSFLRNQSAAQQQTFRSSSTQPKRLSVHGFEFPLAKEDDVELLELAVRENETIGQQFIEYLAAMKAPNMDLVECFGMFFADSAMVNYNWNGFSNQRFPKKAMRTYRIFTDCMLAAWCAHGLTPEVLQVKLKRTVEKINNRRNFQQSKQRRKAKLMSVSGCAIGK